MPLLIVDDSPTNLAVLKSLSANVFNGEVKTFTDSRAAADYALANSADLIIVDYAMPDLNGIDFIRVVRANPLHQMTPIVMVTHSADYAVRVEAYETGVTDFLNKPVDPIEFKARIRNLLMLHDAIRNGWPEKSASVA